MATKKKYIQVEEEYLKQVHKEVCEDWKIKLENKFPTVFSHLIVKLNQIFKVEKFDTCVFKNSPINSKIIYVYSGNKGQKDFDCYECTEEIKNPNKITSREIENILGKLIC